VNVVIVILGVLALTWLIIRAIVRHELRSDVAWCMNYREVTKARTLLALHGHRLDRRTRDALTVWLAEHDKAGEP
jgi:hypothetical protein